MEQVEAKKAEAKNRLVATTVLGAIAGGMGESVLSGLPTEAVMVIAGLVVLATFLLRRQFRRLGKASTETPGAHILIASIAALGAFAGSLIVHGQFAAAVPCVFAVAASITLLVTWRGPQRQR